jgi:hypothetical protein
MNLPIMLRAFLHDQFNFFGRNEAAVQLKIDDKHILMIATQQLFCPERKYVSKGF